MLKTAPCNCEYILVYPEINSARWWLLWFLIWNRSKLSSIWALSELACVYHIQLVMSCDLRHDDSLSWNRRICPYSLFLLEYLNVKAMSYNIPGSWRVCRNIILSSNIVQSHLANRIECSPEHGHAFCTNWKRIDHWHETPPPSKFIWSWETSFIYIIVQLKILRFLIQPLMHPMVLLFYRSLSNVKKIEISSATSDVCNCEWQ